MDVAKAIANPFAAYYNSAHIGRWVIVAYSSLIWEYYPRTMYCLLWIFDLLFLAFTVLAAPGFHNPCAIYAILEEVCVLVWHFCHWILWLDVQGRIGYGKEWVMFYVGTCIWCIGGVIACEAMLFCFGIVGDRCGEARPEAANQFEDNAFSELSNNELNNKIQTYNTMRSGVKQQDSNRN